MASDPRYGGFNHAGISYKHQAALTTAYQVFTLTADTTNCARTANVPPFAELKNINFELDTIAGGASKVTFYLPRDLAGDIPVTAVRERGLRPHDGYEGYRTRVHRPRLPLPGSGGGSPRDPVSRSEA